MRLLKDWRTCLDETDLEMATTTKFHGMRRWFVSGAVVRRTMWGLLSCFSLAVWIYLMTERVRLFNEHQLATSYSAEYPNSMQFPTVTICNFNMLRAQALSEQDRSLLLNVSYAFNADLRRLIQSSPLARIRRRRDGNDKNVTNTLTDEVKKSAEQLYVKYSQLEKQLAETLNVEDFIDSKGWSLEDSNLKCFFGSKTCSLENFTMTMTRFGKCYTYNGNGSITQKVPGRQGGLRLYLNIQEDNYYPYGILGELQQMTGAKVIVHQSFEPPILNTGLAAMPGFEMNVPLRLTVLTTINKEPWNTCNDGPIGPYEQYSVLGCLALCRSRAYASDPACKCRPWYLPKDQELEAKGEEQPICSISQTIYCSFFIVDDTDREMCNDQCQEACTTNHFDFDSAYAKLLGVPAQNQMGITSSSGQSSFSLNEIEENWLQISVYYPAFIFDRADSSIAFPIDGLLADFGNYMSMFLGFSVVTMFDLLEYPFLKIYRQCIRPALRKAEARKLNKRHRDPIATVSRAVSDEKTVGAWTQQTLARQAHRKQYEDSFYDIYGFHKRERPQIHHVLREPAKLRRHVMSTAPKPALDYHEVYRQRSSSVSHANRNEPHALPNISFQFLKRSFSISRS